MSIPWNLYRFLNIHMNDPLQCQGFSLRRIGMYLCLGNKLPHEYWVTSASETMWFPSRFKICRRGVIRNSGWRCVMLLYWSRSVWSLINSTPSKDVNEIIVLQTKLSTVIVLAMRLSPKGVLINPLRYISIDFIFLRYVNFFAQFPLKCVEKPISKYVSECPICCKDGSWCNWVCLSLRRSKTKSPVNAPGWTYLTGFIWHDNTCNVSCCKLVFDSFSNLWYTAMLRLWIWALLQYQNCFSRYGDPIIKNRRLRDCLIFIMGVPILGYRGIWLYF